MGTPIHVPENTPWHMSTFSIDDGAVYEGYTQGDHWNGWATPAFEKEVAEKVMAASYPDGWHFEQALDAFCAVNTYAEEEDQWVGEDITVDGKTLHVWAIGAYDWIWDDLPELHAWARENHYPCA